MLWSVLLPASVKLWSSSSRSILHHSRTIALTSETLRQCPGVFLLVRADLECRTGGAYRRRTHCVMHLETNIVRASKLF
jgi:hypothetical protein